MRSYESYARWTTPTPNFGAAGDSLLRRALIGVALGLVLASAPAQAAEYDDALAAFRTGDYAAALKPADAATAGNYADVRWWRLKLDCLNTLGRYRDGVAALEVALRQHYADG